MSTAGECEWRSTCLSVTVADGVEPLRSASNNWWLSW